MLVRLNKALIALSRGMFSYQIFVVVQPLPSLDYLLQGRRGAIRRPGSRMIPETMEDDTVAERSACRQSLADLSRHPLSRRRPRFSSPPPSSTG